MNTRSKYQDSVFRSYFHNPQRLLSVCNDILGTNYIDNDKLNINTLEGIFFNKQKNDISCTIDNHLLILIEYQSTVNLNMPSRCLAYVTELLNNLVEDKLKLYHQSLINFPVPRFVVLYNGDKNEPIKKQMRLSDDFNGDSQSLELVVTIYNINYGLPQPLLEKCSYLNECSILVSKVKDRIKKRLSPREAINHAVKFCLDKGLMKSYLEINSQEVFNMSVLEWNLDDALQARFDDGTEYSKTHKAETVALKLLKRGRTFSKIHEDTELPLNRIEQLAKIISNS